MFSDVVYVQMHINKKANFRISSVSQGSVTRFGFNAQFSFYFQCPGVCGLDGVPVQSLERAVRGRARDPGHVHVLQEAC